MQEKLYVHYGQDKFNPFHEYKYNTYAEKISKPPYGLWGSPVTAHYSWENYCIENNFRIEKLDKKFYFVLASNAKILTITSIKDIDNYVIDTKEDFCLFRFKLDIQRIMREYDGLELIHNEDNYYELHDSLFFSYDADSIVVWNLMRVIQIDEKYI